MDRLFVPILGILLLAFMLIAFAGSDSGKTFEPQISPHSKDTVLVEILTDLELFEYFDCFENFNLINDKISEKEIEVLK